VSLTEWWVGGDGRTPAARGLAYARDPAHVRSITDAASSTGWADKERSCRAESVSDTMREIVRAASMPTPA